MNPARRALPAAPLPYNRPVMPPSDSLFPAPVFRLVAGVDEAGRGPLAGPVTVAAVILDPKRRINGLNDSKQLSEADREKLYPRIIERAIAWRIEFVDREEIDRLNIFHATMEGMRRAVAALTPAAELARIDGNRIPARMSCAAEALVGGDRLDRAIMAASILAKVARDRAMVEMHAHFPEYGFARHKGYSTPEHLSALMQHGPCEHHRRSFAPVRVALGLQGGSDVEHDEASSLV
ncbi:RNase HII [Pseudoxanthomonas indica]|uniref:Ribonuclease HII n=2 Tax=Pseudoxanthomonas indica TaxID=428993 RepID=A0A1T5J822_9GAMM|nr:ribonuclease HII [Pseudoxanthomonas indica]SKC47590.1 RNase HII [Pseudoxanthomonas indica]